MKTEISSPAPKNQSAVSALAAPSWATSFAAKCLLFTAFICLFSQTNFAQPLNNNACDATVLTLDAGCSGNPYTTALATQQSGEPFYCGSQSNSVWFKFTAPASGAVRVSSSGSSVRKALLAVGDCADFGTFTSLQCVFSGDLLQGGLSPGTEYWLRVTSTSSTATFCLQVQNLTTMPANDGICSATLIQVDSSCAGDLYTNADATRQPGEPTSCANSGGTVWFKFTAPSTGAVRIATTNDNESLATAVYYPSSGGCSTPANFIQQVCEWSVTNLELSNLMPDSTYYIQSTALFGEITDFCLTVETMFPPANDSACAAIMLAVGGECADEPYNLTGATYEEGEPDSCFSSLTSAWFKFVVPSGVGGLEVYTWSSDFWPVANILTVGECGDFSTYATIGCEGFGPTPQFFDLTPGDTIYIQINAYSSNTGSYCVSVDTIFQWFADFDEDGYGDPNDFYWSSDKPYYYVADSTDCNDAVAGIHPGATEICDALDQDCDGIADENAGDRYFADADGDGYGNVAQDTLLCAYDESFSADSTDCNDANGLIYPTAPEACDGLDNDCDGQTDENTPTWFADADGDGFGNAMDSVVTCAGPSGYVLNSTDCNDAAAAAHPGATEICDAFDNDCDGLVNEGLMQTYYADADGDTYGNPAADSTTCAALSGYVSNSTDCDDAHASAHPGGTEVCDLVDNDCDGTTDEGFTMYTRFADADGDLFGNAAVTISACMVPPGYASIPYDCNDSNPTIHYGAAELCDNLDNDCDTEIDEGALLTFWLDADADGYGEGFGYSQNFVTACSQPAGYAPIYGDCNDANPAIHTGATEVCNGLDDDCDGGTDEGAGQYYYLDADGDGYGNGNTWQFTCSTPSGYVADGTDCHDGNANIHPGVVETCDNIDQDCDGQVDEGLAQSVFQDADGDGYGSSYWGGVFCTVPVGWAANDDDCNDANANIHPGATEICENSLDENCDGSDVECAPTATNDLGVESVLSPSANTTFALGSQPIQVVIRNFGMDTIESATIKWRLNNVPQTDFAYSGGGLSPNQRDTITIGTAVFGLGAYSISALTFNPDGMADTVPTNDSIGVSNLYAALNGTYTIGGMGSDFWDFTAAANQLNFGGMLGDVVMNVRNGVYEEQLVLGEIPGSSSANTLLFQSESGDSSAVTLLWDDDAALVFDGTDYTTFKQISVESNSFFSDVVLLQNGANHISLLNCDLKLSFFNSQGAVVKSDNTSVDDYLTVQNCRIENGADGIQAQGHYGQQMESGFLIENNDFINTKNTGIYLSYQNAPKVNRNRVQLGIYGNNGIYLFVCSVGTEVLKNKIVVPNGSGLNVYGLAGTSANPVLIANNFISVGEGYVGNDEQRGAEIYQSSHVNFYHNNVRISGTSPGNRVLYNYFANGNKLINNVLVNAGTGGHVIYNASATIGISQSNHNVLYSGGANLGYWAGTTAATLADWQTAPGQDANSISEDPFFLSATDLHVQNINLDSAGMVVLGVDEDFDGQTRSATHPDIGADEFVVFSNNAGIVEIIAPETGCELGSQSVTIRMRNFTAGDLTGFDVGYQLGASGEVVIENVGGFVLPANATVDYTFAQTANFANHDTYELTAWVAVSGDGYTSNDTLAKTVSNGEPMGNLSNLLPADGATDVTITVSGYSFSWSQVTGATAYDFYLWEDGAAEPTTPTLANQTAINIYYHLTYLTQGGVYHWRVVPKNAFCSVPGPLMTFTVAEVPDLAVTNVTVPPTIFSGQNVEISWEVKNVGDAETGYGKFWFDEVFLSDDTILDPFTDLRLGYKYNFTALLPQQSYTSTGSFFLLNSISGDFYVLVRTNNEAFTLPESNLSNNVKYSDATMDVELSDYSDLVVTAASAPATSFGGQKIAVDWTVKNIGPGHTDRATWTDRVFLTQDTVNMSGAVEIASRMRTSILEPDSTYSVAMTTIGDIPLSAHGAYFLVFRTDAGNNIWEFVYETNNRRVLPITILLTPPPDLYVTEIDLPDTIHYGQVLPFGHTVTNQGVGPTHGSFQNTLRLSLAAEPLPVFFTGLASVDVSALPQNQSDSLSKDVQIPFYLQPGDYYGYVRTDSDEDIFEYDKEDNNISRTPNVIKLIAPDLVVSNLQVPTNASAGQLISVTWTVTNNSFGGIYNAPSKAIIYFSESNSAGSLSSAIQFPFNFTVNLAPNASLTRTMQVTVPCALTTGNYYVFVKEDAWSQIIETNDLNNLSSPPATISVQYAACPTVDYAVTALATPATTSPCLDVTLTYTVKNLSTTTQGRMLCKDYIVLSTDTIWNSGDEILDKIDRSVNLQPQASIEQTATVRIPELPIAGGNYYLLVAIGEDCSPNEPFYDSNAANNLKWSAAINVPAVQPPDLIVSSDSVPTAAQSGQSIHLEYTVKNDRVGGTNVTNWVDKIYLSATPSVNPLGQGPNQWPLATIQRTSALDGGQTYTHSGDFTIPLGVPTGNYFVVFVSDFNDNVCEWDKDDNNQKSEYIFVQQPPPSDLVVTSIVNTDTVTAGDFMNVSWTVRNEGAHSAIGGVKHVVYLSSDPNWDITDVVIGSAQNGILLHPSQSTDYSMTLQVTGAGVGNYYVLVRTDALDQIYESDNTNNVGSGGDLLTVMVKELVIDELTPDSLMPNVPLYYRIEVPASLVGETMAVSLTTPDSVAASNQLYLRYGNVPTLSEFDFSFSTPIYGNQESVVPVLQEGTYYLMAYGNKVGGGQQNIQLLAHLRPFEITSVNADKGGNTGFVTVQISGAKFDPNMIVSLLGDTTIVADTLYYVSPAKVFARFNLDGAPIGSYHMEALKPNIDTTLRESAFEVVPGGPDNLIVAFRHQWRIPMRVVPEPTGPFRPTFMVAQYKNAGLNDLQTPVVPVKSLSGIGISLSSNDLATTGGSLQILMPCIENNGPQDVLRPGAEGSVIIYMMVSNVPTLIADLPNK